jgi:hypothetical protein
MRFLFPVALTIALTIDVSAQTTRDPIDILSDDGILKSAETEILSMQYPQLSAFTKVLSECDYSSSPNEVIRHRCQAQVSAYEIEFGSGSQLDKLVFAINAISLSLSAPQAGGKPTARNDMALGNKIGDLAFVNAILKKDANARFHKLRQP